MKMYKILFLFLLLFPLNGCLFSGCKKLYLSKFQKEWIQRQRKGEQFVYKSNYNRIDTLTIIKVSDEFSDCNKLEMGEYIGEVAEVDYKSILFAKSGKIHTLCSTTEDPKNKFFNQFLFKNIRGETNNRKELEKFHNKIKINSIRDSISVYTFSRANTKYSNDGIIKSFSWNQKYGFVRYTTKKGEVFELVKSIKPH